MRLRFGLSAAASVALLAATIVAAQAQSNRAEVNACFATLIRNRMESQQPVRLSADTITLTGNTLSLTGRAWVRFNGASIGAEQIVLDPATKRIDLIGNVSAFLGSEVACGRRPRIEFR